MKKIFKIIGIAIISIIGIIVLLFVLFWGSVEFGNYTKRKEGIRYQKEVCDTIKTVQGNFPVEFRGFDEKELEQIHLYLEQDRRITRDTVVKADIQSQSVLMPFDEFKTVDWIIVSVGNRYFTLSGFSYKGLYRYGMFGPTGSCECVPTGFEHINGKPKGYGYLIKKYGLLDYQLPPRR